MTSISRARLVFIVLALCAVLSIVPLASAQTEPLPMPENFPTLGQMADRGTRNASTDLMATAAFANGGDASTNVLQEGGAPVEVNITLNAQPTTPVTLTYGMNNNRYSSTAVNNVIVYPKQITFTPENWDIPQTVEIHALENYRVDNYNLGLDGAIWFIGTLYGYAYEQTDADGTYRYGHVNFGGGHNDPFNILVEDNPTPPAAPTGSLVVTTLADSYSTLIEGSLRQMLLLAESRNLPSQTITFQEGLTGTINLAADMPELTRRITLAGPGQNSLTIDGGNQFVGLTGSTIAVQDLTLANLLMAAYVFDLTLTDVTVRDSGPGARMLYQSGAVFAGEVTATRSTFTGNEGILSGALILVGDQYTITDSVFTDNHALPVQLVPGSPIFGEGGGAIYILTESGIESGSISNSTFSDNSGSAGAIFSNVNWSGAIQIITDSTFANNIGEWVGAIWAYNNSHLVTFNSTFANNTGKSVGAILIEDDAFVEVYNSTFSANAALSPTGTAAIYHPEGMPGANTAVSQIIFSTFSGHNTGQGSGGVLNGNIVFFASVIANNSAPNPVECLNGAGGNDYLVFSTDPACGPYAETVTIPLGVDPVLRDNSGSTMTHALLPGSNVIDSDTPRGEDGSTVCSQRQEGEFATDQRGVDRPQFQYCDFGAFEADDEGSMPLPTATFTLTPEPTLMLTPSLTPEPTLTLTPTLTPSLTPSLTPTLTPTLTLTPSLTPSLTPTLTPVNLLTNPSFEAAGATDAEALGWTTRNLRPIDRRWCGDVPSTASDGDCTFRFRGPNLTAAPRRLTQTVLADMTWGAVGDTLTLSADIRTREWGAASRLLLTVTYTDGTTESVIVRIPSGSNAYQTLTASLTLTKPAASATVLVRVKTGGTKKTRLWVDNVVLVSQ